MAYRILSLSGRGIRGIFQAIYLQSIAEDFNGFKCERFFARNRAMPHQIAAEIKIKYQNVKTLARLAKTGG